MATRTLRVIASLVLAVAGLVGVTLAATSPASAIADRDCGDFGSQAAAQNFYLDQGGPDSDPHRLDADSDGVACESNPCPCSTSQGGGGNGGGGNTNPPPPEPRKQAAHVVKVIDGDSVRVKIVGGRKRDVRVLGIDTPEMSPVQCGARAAKQTMKKILPRGVRVTLYPDRSQPSEDRYNRLLRYVHRRHQGQALDAGWAQVRVGNAKVLVVGKRFARHAKYKQAQAQAKRENVGAWRNCW